VRKFYFSIFLLISYSCFPKLFLCADKFELNYAINSIILIIKIFKIHLVYLSKLYPIIINRVIMHPDCITQNQTYLAIQVINQVNIIKKKKYYMNKYLKLFDLKFRLQIHEDLQFQLKHKKLNHC
jgi:hypothetical protein